MARPKKRGVDYFPHDIESGKMMFMIEQQFGNDGYAFWYKLLELLGAEDRLFYDCRNIGSLRYMQSKTRVNEEVALQILNFLAEIDVIDNELWTGHKVVWVQDFVDRISCVYEKRKMEIPQRPNFRTGNPVEQEFLGQPVTEITDKASFCDRNPVEQEFLEQPVTEITQIKVKETKAKDIKEQENRTPVGKPTVYRSFQKPTVEEIDAYCKTRKNNVNAEQFFDFYEAKGWMIGKSKMKDWKASVRNWERREKLDCAAPNNRQEIRTTNVFAEAALRMGGVFDE